MRSQQILLTYYTNSFMRDLKMEVLENPVNEARRYVDNAKTLLNEHGQLDEEVRIYGDRKYVRMAGNTLWNGVLVMLESVFQLKTKTKHPDVVDYKDAIVKRDGKLLKLFLSGYEIMHINMGYDGCLSKAGCDEGIRIANEIIDRCGKMFVPINC